MFGETLKFFTFVIFLVLTLTKGHFSKKNYFTKFDWNLGKKKFNLKTNIFCNWMIHVSRYMIEKVSLIEILLSSKKIEKNLKIQSHLKERCVNSSLCSMFAWQTLPKKKLSPFSIPFQICIFFVKCLSYRGLWLNIDWMPKKSWSIQFDL